MLMYFVLVCAGWLAGQAAGHGRLIEPPSRASAWRFGFDTPPDYDDNQSFCGGFTRQWNKNGGKCGVCGDPWDTPTPRLHELGGKYGRGIIVRKYSMASEITIKIDLTASHKGYFEFNVCDKPKETTQKCLDQNLLIMDNSNSIKPETKFYPRDGSKIYEMRYLLPKTLTCKHCVLQWRYVAGNNWGMCKNGTSAVGCGPQEEFRACADIFIGNYTAPKTKQRLPFTQLTKTAISPKIIMDTPALAVPMGYSGISIGLLTAGVTLFGVLIILSSTYLYYYRSRHIKNLLKMQITERHCSPAAPVPSPTQTKNLIIDIQSKSIQTIS